MRGTLSANNGRELSSELTQTQYGTGLKFSGTYGRSRISGFVLIDGRNLLMVYAILPAGGEAVADGIVARAVASLHHA